MQVKTFNILVTWYCNGDASVSSISVSTDMKKFSVSCTGNGSSSVSSRGGGSGSIANDGSCENYQCSNCVPR